MRCLPLRLPAGLLVAGVAAGVPLAAATLPVHRPLRILVVSDTANPHGLSSADLTGGSTRDPGTSGIRSSAPARA